MASSPPFTIIETDRKSIADMKLPQAGTYISVFVPKDKIEEVRDIVYDQINSAERVKQIDPTSLWATNIIRGLKIIANLIKKQKEAIRKSETGYSFYIDANDIEKKVYLIKDCAPVNDLRGCVLSDDEMFHATCPHIASIEECKLEEEKISKLKEEINKKAKQSALKSRQ
jgi:hypothetical protein